jgi:hypothetical protein
MKKIILLTSLFLALSSSCQEQQEDPVTPIFNEIRQEIISANPESPEWDLEIFLRSPKAAEFKQKIQPLPRADKNRLILKIGQMQQIKAEWPAKRDFLAISVEAGGDIDTNLNIYECPQTFLGDSVWWSDFQAVEFALKYNAYTNSKSRLTFPLELAKNYHIAQLLIDTGALQPIRGNQREEFDLLSRTLLPTRSYQLLKHYSKEGLNFGLKDSNEETLLHFLCLYANETKQNEFFEKFSTLYGVHAPNLDARNIEGQTALNIIEGQDQNNETVKLARALLEGLEKNPSLWKNRLKETPSNQLPEWLARMQLPEE